MKLFRFFRAFCVYGLCVIITCLCSGCSQRSTQMIREEIFSYVENNRSYLIEAMEEIKSWSEQYYFIFNDAGQIKGGIVEWPYNKELITDNTIVDFFAENQLLYCIHFPVNSDIVVFDTEGVGIVPASIQMGFYFSPQDTPAWINSDQLITFSLRTGQYMDYPMIQKENGWVADTSVLDPEKDFTLKKYGLYTERISENFFYYESWP